MTPTANPAAKPTAGRGIRLASKASPQGIAARRATCSEPNMAEALLLAGPRAPAVALPPTFAAFWAQRPAAASV